MNASHPVPSIIPPPLWRAPEPLLLASGSATRLSLVVAAGLPVETRRSGVDERAVEAALLPGSPMALARALARAKAEAVAAAASDRIVLGADQVLALDDRPIAKPEGPADARDQLRRLRGRRHTLSTAACLIVAGESVPVDAEAFLTFRDLTDGEIDGYVARMEADSWSTSGLYRIESLGQHLVRAVQGDHATILGLPMFPLLEIFRARGLLSL